MFAYCRKKVSGLQYNVDFYAGYSPERINPGDKETYSRKNKKVTSDLLLKLQILLMPL